ncbi:predicted hydrolase or acyltransferase (alpha/beta hydrolase superfamily) protein [Plesiocystis pacifica SIR-1]|uniref:Predicted hydrolase or acyltransferase (Alpha/beta hydrolase superfamily) protein n=1 Tax=Plesiocystis pacifica SIR-1 TaxID=391625 RepID=A6G2P3_9BACT|nr:alpha/beta hydrolase [Plesiocystis pacifica]EDM79743.1 predicted hydrolase or acyltransferase (alpha/beta hydrolase superfamily) protein [Plesiocystis pacifica SIR-1]
MPYAIGPGKHRVHYERFGPADAPALVLIQGLGLSGRFWMRMPDMLAGDAKTPWRVLVPDNRGVGKSDRPRRPWTMANMADDVVAMLDAEGVQRAIVAGISMGGMIAQQVALRHAERVAGLILLATWPGLPSGQLPSFATLNDLFGSAIAQRKDPQLIARLLLPDSLHDRSSELLSDWFQLMRETRPSRATFLGQFGAIASHSTGKRLSAIQAPTRVITGDQDRLVVPVNSMRLADAIPGAQLQILPNVGHAIPLLDREVVRRHALDLRPNLA